MELRNLRFLVTLARRLNYSRAAQELGISQPALTRAIQNLEKTFNIRFFDRDRSNVRLTAQAIPIVERAKTILAEADDLERQIHLTATGTGGRVRFGMAPLPARLLLTDTLKDRLETAPELANDVVLRRVDALLPMLVNDEIEFFVCAEGQIPESPPLRQEVLGRIPAGPVVRKGHPLLTDRKAKGPFPALIASRGVEGTAAYNATIHIDDLPNLQIDPIHVIEDYQTLIELAMESDAILIATPLSILDKASLGNLAELSTLRAERPAEMRIILYSLQSRSQSPGMIALKQVFRTKLNELNGRWKASGSAP